MSNHSGLKFVKTGEKIYSLVSGLVNNSQLSRQQINLKESDTGGKKDPVSCSKCMRLIFDLTAYKQFLRIGFLFAPLERKFSQHTKLKKFAGL